MKNKMKNTYIVPETEVVNIELENMIAASLGIGGDAKSNGITEAGIKEIMDWIEFEESNNSSLW